MLSHIIGDIGGYERSDFKRLSEVVLNESDLGVLERSLQQTGVRA